MPIFYFSDISHLINVFPRIHPFCLLNSMCVISLLGNLGLYLHDLGFPVDPSKYFMASMNFTLGAAFRLDPTHRGNGNCRRVRPSNPSPQPPRPSPPSRRMVPRWPRWRVERLEREQDHPQHESMVNLWLIVAKIWLRYAKIWLIYG